MMGELKTKMEEQLELYENWRLQKEPTNKEQNKKKGGVMEKNKIKERQNKAEEEQGKWREYARTTKWDRCCLAKETQIANRELMEEITNNERNEIEEGQMEEIEIKEGHDDVEEQDNKITMPIFNKKESTFSSPWKFCRNQLNEERGEVEGNKLKEGQEEVQEEQDNEPWIFPPREIDISFLRAKWDHYLRMRFCRGRKQAFEEMKIRRLEIENFWKHALGKDMNIIRILKSGSLRFLKQQIQDVWQLLRCKVCLDSDACMVFFPCRHMATCEYCGSFLDQCPVCRTFIEETVKVNKK